MRISRFYQVLFFVKKTKQTNKLQYHTHKCQRYKVERVTKIQVLAREINSTVHIRLYIHVYVCLVTSPE